MTNFNESLKTVTTIEELKTILNQHSAMVLDNNNDFTLTFQSVDNAVKTVNATNRDNFSDSFILKLSEDRKEAFESLATDPAYTIYKLIINQNGTYTTESTTRIFRFSDIEKRYQTMQSTSTDKDGKPILNKSVTVFGSLRVYGLTDCFTRNCLKSNLTIDKSVVYKLENVKIDNNVIFSENDGECFQSNSNNKLEEQVNIIARFLGDLDVKLLKKDVAVLKLAAQKVNTTDKNHLVVKESKTLTMLDRIFSAVTMRRAGCDAQITINA